VSKAFIVETIQESTGCTGVTATAATADLIVAIVSSIKKDGGFTRPSFGTLRIAKTKARKALSRSAGEPVKVKAGKSVRFKANPSPKKEV